MCWIVFFFLKNVAKTFWCVDSIDTVFTYNISLSGVHSRVSFVVTCSMRGMRRCCIIPSEEQIKELVRRELLLVPVAVVVLVMRRVIGATTAAATVRAHRLVEKLGAVVVVVLAFLCVAQNGERLSDRCSHEKKKKRKNITKNSK